MKECRYFLDTNIFLRIIVKDDLQKAKECENLFKLIQDDKITVVTSTLVLMELAWTGMGFYKISKEEMIKILKGILKMRGLKIIDKFNLLLAISLFEKYNIKLIDAFLASNPLILQGKLLIISYDRDFDKIGLKRVEPKAIKLK